MPDPLAYFLTWTTYGSWLPGDERGWVFRGKGFQVPNPILKSAAAQLMSEPACFLNSDERTIVERTIREHCQIRNWELHAVNCRTNHVHVVVSANREPENVRDEFKAWCTRKLKERQQQVFERIREKWWTERGSQRLLGDQESLEAAIRYVLDGQ
jgi:REP element-mobilizing transposase RayT